MHLVWIDLIPLLVSLYSTDFKDLDQGAGEYRIAPHIWRTIGKAAKDAGDTIPSVYGRRVPDLADERGYRTAETWSVWTLYIAPGSLKGRFPRNKYYNHFMQLVRLLDACIELEIPRSNVATIRQGFIDWVNKFEEYFYQYDPSRVSICTSIIHYLLHIADCIEMQGPVWVYWAFVMERHCGRIVRAVRSCKHPWASLNNFVLAEAQLETVQSLYNLDNDFFTGPNHHIRAAGSFARFTDYETCELLAPSRMSPVTPYLASQLANVLAQWYGETYTEHLRAAIKSRLPHHIEEWGKVRRLDGGDTMHAADLIVNEERDMTFVRYEQLVDRRRHQQHKTAVLKRQAYYGQLRRILVLPVSPPLAELLGDDAPQTVLIAAVAECADLSPPDAHGLQFFSKLKDGVELTELRTIECLIGRVPTHSGHWAIADRSNALSRVLFTGSDVVET
ncbi:hypothetical protein EXIGLDRAFT_675855 [Exidia glandulosa HHB12029]|uniref:DUF4218 domain-containing protein n=1 Tax=Exidia glandulosa HHB12029 TaxID=1314781 RepID=A0A165HAA4_EXIGL|nr:hypothetical protein EXIGLDRAFT_675855 [Exidia glandulosa HHB12029]